MGNPVVKTMTCKACGRQVERTVYFNKAGDKWYFKNLNCGSCQSRKSRYEVEARKAARVAAIAERFALEHMAAKKVVEAPVVDAPVAEDLQPSKFRFVNNGIRIEMTGSRAFMEKQMSLLLGVR